MSNTRLYTPESHALAMICREWYLSFGALTAAVVVSLWVSPLWMPIVDIVLGIVLVFCVSGKKLGSTQPCGRIRVVTIVTLIFTGLISLAINLCYKTEFIHKFFDISTLNHSIPYITSLILFPVCAFLSGIFVTPAISHQHSHTCYLHNQYNPSHPMYSRMVHATYRSLLGRLALMALIISIVDWGYYFICYENSRITRPDRFFFFVVPAAIYVWSIIYVRGSYSLLTLTNGQTVRAAALRESDHNPNPITDSTIIRYLIIHKGELLLNINQSTITDCSVDTPVIEIKPLDYQGDVETATQDFKRATGLTDITVKYLYTSEPNINNNRVLHFLVTLDEELPVVKASVLGNATSCPLGEIDRLLRMGVLSPQLATEIFRIYTMAMAWKTYDRRGRRLYPIRNYRPNFRLADLHKYEVDYSDMQWLRVSRINQDSPLWFIRRIFL